MTSIKYPLAGCVAAAALGALAAVGVAHAQPAPMAQGGGAPGQGGGEAQLQQLHDALQLTPREEQAWQGYQVARRPSPDQMQQMHALGQMQLGAMSAPQRLDIINQGLMLQLSVFHRNAEATRAFYATLTPSQQKTFDQVTAPVARNAQRR